MSDATAGTVETEESIPRPKETWRRLIQGDLASLRVVIGLALIWAIFQFENDRFLSAQNLTNLMLQIAATGLISVGVVYVLLLGEIDLSVGAVSGLAAAVMAVLNVKHGWNPYLAIAAAVLVGMAIGVLQGSLFSRFVVPSFVVTLAGLLAWQGALLQVLGSTGSINLTDPKITGLANTFYSDTVGWIIAAVVIAGYGAVLFLGHRRRLAAGLDSESLAGMVVRFALVAVVTIVATTIFNSDRGTPLAVLILLGFVVGMEFVVKRTGFGRHFFAVGGNAEAARRAGINVDRVRIIVFMINGFMAGVGGVILASRLRSVATNAGGGNLLLNVIAAAVIGGTSLFGGRGRVVSALLGALVIASIQNGMGLLNLSSGPQFVITGLVLLAAVLVDSLSRRRRTARGAV
jgi:D-xylose transport system permease protein